MEYRIGCYDSETTFFTALYHAGEINGHQYRTFRGQHHAGDRESLTGYFRRNFTPILGETYWCESCGTIHGTYEYR